MNTCNPTNAPLPVPVLLKSTAVRWRGDRDLPPAEVGGVGEEEVGAALAARTRGPPAGLRPARAGSGSRRWAWIPGRLSSKQIRGTTRSGGPGIRVEDGLHRRHEAGIAVRGDQEADGAPWLDPPFWRARRTVSTQMVSTISSSIDRAVSSRSDQRAKPGGGSVQAMAAIWRIWASGELGWDRWAHLGTERSEGSPRAVERSGTRAQSTEVRCLAWAMQRPPVADRLRRGFLAALGMTGWG